ncbi:unnamed protein product [Effrenium voratum]|nr:unnamed protein product [Effrenium voratum]
MSQEPAECSLVRRDTSSLEPPLSPLECLRKVARRFGLLDAPPPPVPQKESEPQQPGNVQRGEPPPTATWWTLLPLEPSKYERVVVFDTETSGFSGEDEILEIGAVELEVCSPSPGASYAILRPTGVSFHSLLQTSREIHAKAAQVNGLCQKDLEAAMPRPLAIRSFLRFLAGEKTALVAHNAAFDLRMLLQDLKRCGMEAAGKGLGKRTFCSAAAFGAIRPASPRDLTTACYLLDIREGSPDSAWRNTVHSALVDAALTAKVVLAMASMVSREQGQHVEFGPACVSLPCRLPVKSPPPPDEADRGRKRRLPASFAAPD